MAVYIMRIFMIVRLMVLLIRIPVSKESTNDNVILVKFCAHVLTQILVHLIVILVVAAKINNEHISLQMRMVTGTELSLQDNASPFLIVATILGEVIPIAGVLTFFGVNYYWIKEFSIGFWLNMMSLLQGESFAETVFGGETLSITKERALDFVEKAQYKKVKKQLKLVQETLILDKVLFSSSSAPHGHQWSTL